MCPCFIREKQAFKFDALFNGKSDAFKLNGHQTETEMNQNVDRNSIELNFFILS